MMRLPLLLAAAALLAAAPASAFVNGPLPYTAEHGFAASLEDASLFVVGAVEVRLVAMEGTQVYLDTNGFSVEGLERVCRGGGDGPGACHEGPLAVHVAPGSSFAVRLPDATQASYGAPFALSVLVDLADAFGDELDLRPSLVAVADAGEVLFGALPGIPVTPEEDLAAEGTLERFGGLSLLMDGSHAEVVQDGAVVDQIDGDEGLLFQGAPRIAPFRAQVAAMPFQEGAHADFAPGPPTAVRDGLRLDHLAGEGLDGSPAAGPLGDLLGGFMNGAILRLPLGDAGDLDLDRFLLVRFDRLEVTADPGLTWRGDAPLHVHGASVEGAGSLVGVGWFQVPWWSLALWAAALVLAVAGRRPPKQDAPALHEGPPRPPSRPAGPPGDAGPDVPASAPAAPEASEPRQAPVAASQVARAEAAAGKTPPAPPGSSPASDARPGDPSPAGPAGPAAPAGPAEPAEPTARRDGRGPLVPRWIGVLASLGGLLLLVVLWDRELRILLGSSLLTTDATGTALALTAALQLGTLMLGLLMASLPLAIALRGGLSLAGLHGLRPLAGGVAHVAAFFLWATVLRSYLELLLQAMVPLLAGMAPG